MVVACVRVCVGRAGGGLHRVLKHICPLFLVSCVGCTFVTLYCLKTDTIKFEATRLSEVEVLLRAESLKSRHLSASFTPGVNVRSLCGWIAIG